MDQAPALLEGELAAAGRPLAGLGTQDAWEAFLRFGRQLFDVPDVPDADGLLFQYGTYAFNGPEAFTLDLTRQFEVADSDGDHDHHVHVRCELRYDPVPALRDLGSSNSWFFHGPGRDLDEWARHLTAEPAWATIRALRPSGVAVHRERV